MYLKCITTSQTHCFSNQEPYYTKKAAGAIPTAFFINYKLLLISFYFGLAFVVPLAPSFQPFFSEICFVS